MKSNKTLSILDKSSWAILYFVAAVSPLLSLFAPLSLAVCFVLAALFPAISAIVYRRYLFKDIFNSNAYKFIALFFVLGISSLLWAIEPKQSFSMWCRLLLLFVGLVALLEFIKQADIKNKQTLCKTLAIAFFIALVTANIEIISDGSLSKFFQSFKAKEYKCELTDLNRGASYLVIIFWCVLSWLIVRSKLLFAVLLTVFTIFTVLRLESQSSSMALIISLAVFPLISVFGKRALKAMMVLAVFAVISVAALSHKMNPQVMFDNIPEMPNSATEYRLYIWDYTAKRAMEKPVLGWGLNSARSIPITKEEYVLGGRHPLPLHPHNNVLQVWLELGFVGLAVFIAFLVSQIYVISNLKYSIINTHCKSELVHSGKKKIIRRFYENFPASMFFGLFSAYFAMGETGYGIWQNWWVAGGLLSLVFTHSCFSIKKS
ncbi:MAG: O-antigen ligase family protein [Rickettsiales bacterium]|nr:O-antigen ligase family protein [Pseudomonadota bacterium]MDA0967446.1 O-antigen ligase family protein [Pseudomonadota bacterium]MDG4544186.1 O-antigen ligase family protein [Rickettsiales bacterium]MDG4546367.1 O-antigen ligase family protein [Rickettsiales bacterium]MDG4548510.1 O-antigen ligase family protein [Rickettsiales bacterium]